MKQFDITLRPFKMESDNEGTYPHLVLKRKLTTEESCYITHEILLIDLYTLDDFWDEDEYNDYLTELTDDINNWLIGECDDSCLIEALGTYSGDDIGIWNAFKIAEYLIQIDVI